jgi:chromosomal replication initiator protein
MYERIKEVICKEMNVLPEEIEQGSRRHRITFARMILVYYMRKEFWSLNEIGKKMQKDHTTILYYLNRYKDLYKYDKDFKRLADKIEMLVIG